jgi:hypothetical protein
VAPPRPAQPNHHGEALLTAFGRQTQRPQRRIRFTPHHQRNPTTTESCFCLRSVSRISARKYRSVDRLSARKDGSDSPPHHQRNSHAPNAHMGTDAKQMVHSIEACYIAPVGHFHEEHEGPRRAEIQHRRYSNPRRVEKKKLFDPRSRQERSGAHSRPNSEQHTINAETRSGGWNRRSISCLTHVEKEGD